MNPSKKMEGDPMTNNPPETMTIDETAQYLRISQSSLYKLTQEGRIPCQKVGWHWRFHRGAGSLVSADKKST